LKISTEIQGYRRPALETQPEYLHPAYLSSIKRAPTQPLVTIPHTLSEVTGPQFTAEEVAPTIEDLTRQHKGEPLGEKIIVS
jgi:protocatechuate 3,4-dioxygenase beta subunit